MAVLAKGKGRCHSGTPVCLMFAVILLAGPAWSATDSLGVLYNNLAVMHGVNGDFEIARAYLDSARLMGADEAAILNNLANCMLCQGFNASACSLYDSCQGRGNHDSLILYNQAVALYLGGETETSVETMRLFTEYAMSHQNNEFVSGVMADLGETKASSLRVSKEELKRLLEKARNRRDRALKAEPKSDSLGARQAVATAQDSVSREQRRIKKKLIPAGEKAQPSADLASMLYWKLL